MPGKSQEKLNRAIVELYACALNPQEIHNFLAAWDEAGLNPDKNSYAKVLANDIALADLKRHAQKALNIVNLGRSAAHKTAEEVVEGNSELCFAMNTNGKIIAANSPALSKLGITIGQSACDIPLKPVSQATLNKLLRQGKAKQDTMPVLLLVEENGDRLLPLLTTIGVTRTEGLRDISTVFVHACRPGWSQFGATLIRSTFNLTLAEIDVLRELIDGLSTNEIASKRNRSIETVRKQIKSILAKMGSDNRAGLLQTVAAILQISSGTSSPIGRANTDIATRKRFYNTNTTLLPDGRSLQFLQYGSPFGTPVLFFHLNSSPYVSRRIVSLIADAGLQIIAPIKPGSGETSRQIGSHNPTDFARDGVQLMQQLRFASYGIAGHNMGGIYALDAAMEAVPDSVIGLAMIDTGAPIDDAMKIVQMPPSSRRTFLVAKDEPHILYAPYAIAAELFFKDRDGRSALIDMGYEDSQIDTVALSDPEIRRLVERNLSYTFDDPKWAVDDLIHRLVDWGPKLRMLSDKIPILSLHGQEHDWLAWRDVEKMAEWRKDITVIPIKGAAQLGLYTHSDTIIRKMSLWLRRQQN